MHKRIISNENKNLLLIKSINDYFSKKEFHRKIHFDGRRFFNVDKFFKWLFTKTNKYCSQSPKDISYSVIVAKHFWNNNFIWSEIGRGGQLMFAFKSKKADKYLENGSEEND